MASRDTLDSSRNLSEGLHNLLTGLTAHSPGSSSPTNATAATTLSPASAATIEQTLFNTPNRSIFTSGPPTSSLSVSTARASLSGAVATNSARPLAALTGPSSSNTSRSRGASTGFQDVGSSSRLPSSSLHRAEKDVDDPTTPFDSDPAQHVNAGATPTALSRLFAGTAVMGPSRQVSYNLSAEYSRALAETASLPEHLYSRGFRDGRHSDITVHAFSTPYALHRLILDRAPFFSSALSGPWFESSAKEITLHPEEIDSNITQRAFELALKRLYGAARADEERQEAASLLATACWLEMTDLVNSSVDALLRQMGPATLASTIELVTNNYYGKAGERLLATAKAMLAREGWQMPLRSWDGIPGSLVRQIIGGDSFFVPGEWERWILAKRLFSRRRRLRAMECGPAGSDQPALPPIATGSPQASSSQHRDSSAGDEDSIASIYDHPDICALAALLETGIHYCHMTFEQLQFIQGQVDVLGRPLVRPEIIVSALWMATELRQKIVNAPDTSVELGLKHTVPEASDAEAGASEEMARGSSAQSESSTESCASLTHRTGDNNILASQGLISFGASHRRFWIPATDSTKVVGDKAEAPARQAANGQPSTSQQQSSAARREDGSDPFLLTHLHESNRPGKVSAKSPAHARASSREKAPHRYYSVYPPFRFSVEFLSPRTMKEKKRVYSQTVWYAGSMWNVYIQKIQATKNMQLGVYLHRVRDREGEDLLGVCAAGPRSVDEAIGQLEREMLMRRQGTRARHAHPADYHVMTADENGDSSGDNSMTYPLGAGAGASSGRRTGLSGLIPTKRKGAQKSAVRNGGGSTSADRLRQGHGLGAAMDDADTDDDDEDQFETAVKRMASTVPALPPYVDARPTIRTYFKIYQMSPEGKTVSVHKSAPDVFNFSQSWGWKSVLDETILGSGNSNTGEIDPGLAIMSATGEGSGSAAAAAGRSTALLNLPTSREERLRFSIVLGNV